jgi:membrane fusion protein, multidrug efflux system
VKSGQRVAFGDLLGELDAWDLEWTLGRAELELQLMELRHASETGQSEQAMAIYDLQHSFQSYYVERLRERFDSTRLTAPYAGVLYNLDMTPGSRVEPYSTVGTLVDPEALMVTALVPTTYLGQVVPGMPVSVTLHANPTVSWPASVSEVSNRSMTSQGGSFFEATIQFQSPDAVPASYQMACTAKILIREGPETVLLPASALIWEGASPYVEIEQDGAIARRDVVVGQRLDDMIEIKSGVEVGQKVLLPK